MGGSVLADTGALVALLDRKDHWHRACADAFRSLRLPLLTSEAVLTEFFHLILRHRHEAEVAWKFLRAGNVSLLTLGDEDLPEIHSLMSRYADLPMDFADATLVYLARRESLTTVFTVDRTDFEVYRIDGRRRFRVLPARLT